MRAWKVRRRARRSSLVECLGTVVKKVAFLCGRDVFMFLVVEAEGSLDEIL